MRRKAEIAAHIFTCGVAAWFLQGLAEAIYLTNRGLAWVASFASAAMVLYGLAAVIGDE